MPNQDLSIRNGDALLSASDLFPPKRLLNSPVIISAKKCAPDTMVLRTAPMNKADAFEVRIGTMPGIWRSAGIYKPASEITIEGLSPGLEYYVEARAMGVSGVSAWSDQVVCN